MSKAYLIARIRFYDEEGFETFKQMSTPLISKYGGFLNMAGVCLLVILKWKRSKAIKRAWFSCLNLTVWDEARQFYFSDGHTAAKLVREKASKVYLFFAEGVKQQT